MQALGGHLGDVELGRPGGGHCPHHVFVAEGGREGGAEGDLVKGNALWTGGREGKRKS